MQEASQKKVVALVAHDHRKQKMLEWVSKNKRTLQEFDLVGTEGTAKSIKKVTRLNVKSIGHGPLGGDIATAFKILNNEIHCLIFFIDTQTAHGHEHDIQSLIRASVTKNIPLALNAKTADCLISSKIWRD